MSGSRPGSELSSVEKAAVLLILLVNQMPPSP